MKTFLLSLAAAALTLAPITAQARDRGYHRDYRGDHRGYYHDRGDNDAWAAVGGFLGGVIVGSILNDHHDGQVVYQQSYPDRYGSGRQVVVGGHWEIVRIRVRVPGFWNYERDSRGILVRVWHPAHYSYENQRVWVSDYASTDRRDCDDWDRR